MNNQIPPEGPIQHLGAVSREQLEPDLSTDGDFASSAEAEAALAADYDTELTEEHLQELIRADTAARVRDTGDYVTEGSEGDYEGSGDSMYAQARGQEPRAEEAACEGSTPSPSAQPKAIFFQTPGHLCSMPQSGPKSPHASAGRALSSPRPVAESLVR